MQQLSQVANAYANASQMVTPIGAVILLYERAMQSALAARQAIVDGRVEDRFNHTQKVGQIVTALQGNLDFENGGDIAPMLHNFYNTIFRRLQEANLRNDVKIMDDVILALNNMRQSWVQVGERMGGAAPSAPRAAEPARPAPAAAPSPNAPKPLVLSV